MRGRTSKGKDTSAITGKGKETVDGTEQGTGKGSTNTRGDKTKKETESIKDVDTSEQAGAGGNVKKDTADWTKKAKTCTWFDVVKGLKP